jgi:hypothetical protein
MRRWVKVAAWAAVFLTCAGVGAYIAAHSNPFPPGVDRPGASPTESPTASASPAPVVWAGTIRSSTYHELYVGGRCTTAWHGRLRFTVDADGGVRGTGSARLSGDLHCDFPIAQNQVRRFGLAVSGRFLAKGLALRLEQASIDPTNGHDFGAFGAFLPIQMLLATHDDRVRDRIERGRVDEQGRGMYRLAMTFDLRPLPD